MHVMTVENLGGVEMRGKQVVLKLDEAEYDIVLDSLINFRNKLISEDLLVDDVNELILKLLNKG